MRYGIPVLLIAILMSVQMIAQPYGIAITGNKKVATISFEKHSNLIIVPIWFDRGEVLNFIVDTGARYTILTRRQYIPTRKVTMDRQVRLIGSDMSIEMIAYLVPQVSMQISNVHFKNQTILVLKEDYLLLEHLLGMPIHGIIGSDLFRRFIVKIDYKNSLLTLYERRAFRVPTDYECLNMVIDRKKPYLYAPIRVNKDVVKPKLLLDTGASVSLLIHPDVSKEIDLPEDVISGNLAYGLGGEVEGLIGRVEQLKLPPFEFRNLVTHFQDLSNTLDSTYMDDREGIIGGELLNRFTVILDYHEQKLYLKPNRKYNRAFDYDRSGMSLLASGRNLKDFIIRRVIPDSPAQIAGVQVGDILLRINGQGHRSLTLRQITKILQGRPNKRIRVVLLRNDEKVKMQFRLKDLI